MRARRVILVGAAVALLGVGALAASFDPDSQRGRITEAVRRATGRQLSIAGPLRVRWGLAPALEAEDVSLANMAGGSRPQMAVAARVEARLRLLGLLSGHVEIASVTLVRPDILIETDAEGRGNWLFDRPAVSGGAPSSGGGPRLATRLDSLRVENGRLAWHDGRSGQTIVADVPHASFDLAGSTTHLQALAQVNGAAITADAALGSWGQVTGAIPGAWPVKLKAAAEGATVSLDGAADVAARSLTGRVKAAIPDLAQLGALLQRLSWPALHDVRFAATLPASGLPQDVSLQVGPSDLGAWLPGATLGSLSLLWPLGQPAKLAAEGAVAGGPWHITSGLSPAEQGMTLRGLSVSSPLGDAAGDLAVATTPWPAVRGALVSARLDADALRRLARPPAASPAPAVAPAPPPPAVPARVFSDAPLPWGVLRRADADLQLTIGTLRLGSTDYHAVAGHLALLDGVLRLDPVSLQAPEGRLDLSASVDARPAAPPVVLNLRSAGFALDPLLQALGLPGGSDGAAQLDVAVRAAGSTPHALASSLDGHAGIALVDGNVSNAALAAALGDALRSAGIGLDPGGRSRVRCLAVRANAQGGQVSVAALKLDASRLTVEGGGTLDLADETMALRLRPLLRLGSAGVSAPMRVDGSLRHPAVVLDNAGSNGRAGVVIGGLAGPADDCAAELSAARDGRPGPLPAEITVKAVKPADLLRSFLR